MFTLFKGLLRSSRPVMIMTALVALLGITGTAYGAKLITGLDIRDGSITAVDLSKNTRAALHGDHGVRGLKGTTGVKGSTGSTGAQGAAGPFGLKGETGVPGTPGADSTVAGPQGIQGAPGATGAAGAASTVAGPQGNVGPAGPAGPGTVEGSACTVPGPLTGVIHWSNTGGTAWTMACIV